MIEGVVNAAYEPVVTLVVRGPSGQTSQIEAVIDTGFTGYLTVPTSLAMELELDFRGTGWAILADRSETTFDVYDAAVLWDGQPRYVEADAADATPLVGMRMMARHNLNMDVEDGGRVVIEAKA